MTLTLYPVLVASCQTYLGCAECHAGSSSLLHVVRMNNESVENIFRIENDENLFVRDGIVPQDLFGAFRKGPKETIK
jgi:hypothetical protein